MNLYKNHIDALMNCILFNEMTADEILILIACLKPRIRRFTKNSIANLAGEPFEGIGVVLRGQASIVKESGAGNRIILAILMPGDIFGEMAAFSGGGVWPATIIAQTDIDIMYIPPDKMVSQCRNACENHRMLIMNMLSILSGKALALSRKLEYLSVKNMRGRIAKFLIEQYRKTGQTMFMLPMNRNEMADFLNVARPSLSREMCSMRDEGLIDFHRSSVRLMNIEGLIAEAEECPYRY